MTTDCASTRNYVKTYSNVMAEIVLCFCDIDWPGLTQWLVLRPEQLLRLREVKVHGFFLCVLKAIEDVVMVM